jgi:hypothetical protein
MVSQRPIDIVASDSQTALDFANRFWLHQLTMFGEQRTEDAGGPPGADRQEDLVDAAQVGTYILDNAAERFESVALPLNDLAHVTIDGQASEIETPRHACAGEVAIE